jgi:hypothetical protein
MERRVFDKDTLISCNRMAQVQGYNRVVEPRFLEALSDDYYVPWLVMMHEHKAGKACEPHVRCIFNHGVTFAIDVELGCWNKLPTVSELAQMIRDSENPQPETVA